MLIEDIHFNLNWISLKLLGYKSLAVNLSDLAAMGAYPKYLFISLALPKNIGWMDAKKLYIGMTPLIKKYSIKILGGDSSRSKSGLYINIHMIGTINNKKIEMNHTIKENDFIYVTGEIGDSSLGYHILKNSKLRSFFSFTEIKILLLKHFHPIPRINEMIYLKSQYKIRQSIDISDGLIGDLKKRLEYTNLGAEIYFEKIPKSQILLKYMKKNKDFTKNIILNGGEDYEILFFSPDRIKGKYFNKKFNTSLKCIGRVTKMKNIKVKDLGKDMQFQYNPYEH